MMRPSVIIQARLSSQRFPGKVLCDVQGNPLIWYVIERISKSDNVNKTVLATSDQSSDDPIFDYCQANNIECFRGDLDNVAKRFKDLIERYQLSSFVRISGDSPLIDPRLIDQGIKIFLENEYDIVTNVLKRTFPKGQSFEIIRSDAFLRGYANMSDSYEQEHVTPYFYENSHEFRIYNMESGLEDCHLINLCVDNEEDKLNFEKFLSARDKDLRDYSWQEIFEFYRKVSVES